MQYTCVSKLFFITTSILCLATGTKAIDNNNLKIQVENSIENIDESQKSCWLDVDPKNFFATMQAIEDKYNKTINEFEAAIKPERMDKEMLTSLLNNRGISQSAVQLNLGNIDSIPAGLDLGGYCMMRMQESILFFHRTKLRNSTKFKVEFLNNDIKSMVLRVKIQLNDLHLHGLYERLMTDKIPSNLFYSPSFGKANVMLKDVGYKVEARYRMLNDRLQIETIVSALFPSGAVMTTEDGNGEHQSRPMVLSYNHIEEFLERMKTDLDEWIKDCINDHLINFGLASQSTNLKYLHYEEAKVDALNNYMDFLLDVMKDKMVEFGMMALALPDFSIFSVNGMIFRLRNGVIRGLDTIYRRSIVTGYLDEPGSTLRHLSGLVGFSSLQVSYKYEAIIETGASALTGLIVLSSKDISSVLSAGIMKDPDAVEILFHNVKQLGPESLTIEGPANKVLGNFRHVIQNHVLALMSYSLNYHIKNLHTITDCEPNIIRVNEGHIPDSKPGSQTDNPPPSEAFPIDNSQLLRTLNNHTQPNKQDNSNPNKHNSYLTNTNNTRLKSIKQRRKRFRFLEGL